METIAVEEDKSSRIFVGGLFDGVTEDDLRDKFQRFGEITSIDIKLKEGAGNTFAFIEMKASPAQVTKCVTTFSKTHWKGYTLKLQLAKESFLTRLQKERDSRGNTEFPPISSAFGSCNLEPLGPKTNGFGSCNLEPLVPQTNGLGRSFNLEPLESQTNYHFSERPFENKRKRRQNDRTDDLNDPPSASRTPFTREKRFKDSANDSDVVADENGPEKSSHPPNSIFLDRLENFSRGVWKDDEATFEVVTEDYSMAKSRKTVDENEDDDGDGDAFENNLMNIKKPTVIVQPPLKAATKITKSAETDSPSTKADSSRKHFLSNERRLQTLDEKLTTMKLRQSLVKAALLNVDSAANRKIVFKLDGEDPDDIVVSKQHTSKEDNKKQADKLTLFDDDDDFEVDDNDDLFDDAEATFRVKPQFQGESGQKLINLQSNYGNDSRFNIDTRFVDNEGVDEPLRDETEEEKLRDFTVLESVLGYQLPAPWDGDLSRKDKHWTEMIPERYDPAREGHEKFEIQRDSTDIQTTINKPSAKSAKRLRKQQEQQEKLQLPVVSTKRFFEVDQNLADAFKRKPDQGTFSLSKMFESTQGVSRDDFKFDGEAAVSSGPRSYWESNPFSYDSSSDEEGEFEKRGHQLEDNKWTNHDPGRHETEKPEFQATATRQTFFLFEDDPRLKEGAELFRRLEDMQTVEVKWRSIRDELISRMRIKRKRLMVKQARSHKREKQDKKKRSARSKCARSKQQPFARNNKRKKSNKSRNKHGAG